MSLETAAERKRKRIVEHVVAGFPTAEAATSFGTTFCEILKDSLKQMKFKMSIGAQDSSLAITPDYPGPTLLKTVVLELNGNEAAATVCEVLLKLVQTYQQLYNIQLVVQTETVREKPLPQTLSVGGRPKLFSVQQAVRRTLQ